MSRTVHEEAFEIAVHAVVDAMNHTFDGKHEETLCLRCAHVNLVTSQAVDEITKLLNVELPKKKSTFWSRPA